MAGKGVSNSWRALETRREKASSRHTNCLYRTKAMASAYCILKGELAQNAPL